MIKPTKEFWDVFKSTNGALSCAEAVAIANLAAQVQKGLYVEYGTFKGKSALAALQGLPEGLFYLYDPEFGKTIDEKDVYKTLGQFDENINHLWLGSDYSTNVIPEYNDYTYVFVDSGSHQDGLPMQEALLLEDRVARGGIIAWHDWDSQFREVKEASDYLVGTGKYEYIPINWDEIIEYVNSENLEEGNQSWHHNELRNPCFVGAVRRK